MNVLLLVLFGGNCVARVDAALGTTATNVGVCVERALEVGAVDKVGYDEEEEGDDDDRDDDDNGNPGGERGTKDVNAKRDGEVAVRVPRLYNAGLEDVHAPLGSCKLEAVDVAGGVKDLVRCRGKDLGRWVGWVVALAVVLGEPDIVWVTVWVLGKCALPCLRVPVAVSVRHGCCVAPVVAAVGFADDPLGANERDKRLPVPQLELWAERVAPIVEGKRTPELLKGVAEDSVPAVHRCGRLESVGGRGIGARGRDASHADVAPGGTSQPDHRLELGRGTGDWIYLLCGSEERTLARPSDNPGPCLGSVITFRYDDKRAVLCGREGKHV